MRVKRSFLWLVLPLALAFSGCNLFSDRTPEAQPKPLDYSWVATTPWAELPGHYDRGNLFMAKNYYDRQKAYASGEIPPPRLLVDAYSSHPLAYYSLKRDLEERGTTGMSRAVPARPAAAKFRPAGNSAAHFARGLAYYDLGDFDGAIKEFTRAIQVDGQHARAYAFRALAYGYIGNTARAQSDLQNAIRLEADPKLIEEVRQALREDS